MQGARVIEPAFGLKGVDELLEHLLHRWGDTTKGVQDGEVHLGAECVGTAWRQVHLEPVHDRLEEVLGAREVLLLHEEHGRDASLDAEGVQVHGAAEGLTEAQHTVVEGLGVC